MIVLAELTGYVPTKARTSTLLYAWPGGYNAPDAPGYYQPRIIDPLNYRRTAFGVGRTFGAAGVDAGLIQLNNRDGGLDSLIDYGFDGRTFRELTVASAATPYASAVVLFTGTMQQAEFNFATVEVRLRDGLFALDRPLQETRYAGDNILPAGVEGTAIDIKGKPKPIGFGEYFMAPLPRVNTSKDIYQFEDGPGGTVANLLISLGSVTVDSAGVYSEQSAMEATAPSTGTYRVWASGGYVRYGGTAAGLVTANIVQGSAASDRLAGSILYRIATEFAGVSSSLVSLSDASTLNVQASGPIGFWVSPDEETTCLDVMNRVAESVGCYIGPDRNNVIRFVQLRAPTGDPVLTFKRLGRGKTANATTADIVGLERIATNDVGGGVPAYRVVMHYKRAHVLVLSDINGSASADDRALASRDYRTTKASSPAVLTKHPLATVLEFTSEFASEADAQAEAQRRLDLYAERRDFVRIITRLDATQQTLIDIGNVVEVVDDRFGYTAGRDFRIIGIEYDVRRNRYLLDLWG